MSTELLERLTINPPVQVCNVKINNSSTAIICFMQLIFEHDERCFPNLHN